MPAPAPLTIAPSARCLGKSLGRVRACTQNPCLPCSLAAVIRAQLSADPHRFLSGSILWTTSDRPLRLAVSRPSKKTHGGEGRRRQVVRTLGQRLTTARYFIGDSPGNLWFLPTLETDQALPCWSERLFRVPWNFGGGPGDHQAIF